MSIPNVSGFWTGDIFGTNRGGLTLDIKQEGDKITGIAKMHEPALGQYEYHLAGQIKDGLAFNDDAHWRDTEIAGVQVQEVAGERPGERIIVIRQRIAERAEAGGKTLFDLPAYRFQALITNLPASEFDALAVWRRYNGRADIENRLKELGRQFGIKCLCAAVFGRRRLRATWRSPPTTCACCCSAGSASSASANW